MNLYKRASVTHTFRAVSKLTIRILKTVQTLFFISPFISRLFNSYIYIHMYAATLHYTYAFCIIIIRYYI